MRRRTIFEMAFASTALILIAAAALTPWYYIISKDSDDPTIVLQEGTYYLQEYQETEYYIDPPFVRTAPSYEPRSFIVFEQVGILMDFELLSLLLAGTALVLSLTAAALKEHFIGFGLAVVSSTLSIIAVIWFSVTMPHAVDPRGLTVDTFWGDGTDWHQTTSWGPSLGWFMVLAAIPFEIGVAYALSKEWNERAAFDFGQFRSGSKEVADTHRQLVTRRKMIVGLAVVTAFVAVTAVAYLTVIARSDSCVTLYITDYDQSCSDQARVAIYIDDGFHQEVRVIPGAGEQIVFMLTPGSHTIGFDYSISESGELDEVIDAEYSVEITSTDERVLQYEVGEELRELL